MKVQYVETNLNRKQLIELIKEKVDLVEVMLDEGVDVDISTDINGECKAVCPFHDDHNPSMSVNSEKGVYNCFACGAGGDVIKFIQETRETDFNGALQILSKYLDLNSQIFVPNFFKVFDTFRKDMQKILDTTLEEQANSKLAPLPHLVAFNDKVQKFYNNGVSTIESILEELAKTKYDCKIRALKYNLDETDNEKLIERLKVFEKKLQNFMEVG